MILRSIVLALLAILMPGIAGAQETPSSFPNQVLIARHTFFDFGPPFDFYEVLSLKDEGSSTSVERILVTPAGNACIQPPTVEDKAVRIDKPLAVIMQNKNPCDIPEKALRQERKRCKHCLVYSGVNVTLGISCKTGDRRIRTDILDKDLFDRSPNIPPNTSWTMAVLGQIDRSLGPSVMDKPAFSVNVHNADPPNTSDSAMLKSMKEGSYDGLFDSDKKLSEIYRQSLEPSRLPSVEIVGMVPTVPLAADLPPYPPIARAAHVEGEVSFSFEVSPVGKVERLSFESGPELLRRTVGDSVTKWQFPESADTHHEEGKIAFRLNCPQTQP
jgi:hypothetical protein